MTKKSDHLHIQGAKEHNLKNVSLDIPHGQLTVVTGLSGSGKSSLAFDTVYAEGQRRYLETFSPYTRQFFDKVKKPDVDLIDHVRPAVAIQQRTRVTSSRSTVGSMTNINDYLKLIWSNLAQPVCPQCGIEYKRSEPDELSRWVAERAYQKPQSTWLICASVKKLRGAVPKKKTAAIPAKSKRVRSTSKSLSPSDAKNISHYLSSLGFNRIFDTRSGMLIDLEESSDPALFESEKLLLVLERYRASSHTPLSEVLSSGRIKELEDAVRQSFSFAGLVLPHGYAGEAACTVIEHPGESSSRRPYLRVVNSSAQQNIDQKAFSLHEFYPVFRCSYEDIKLPTPRPSLFSFNHPRGACPDCKGFGKMLAVDINLCIPNPTLSLKEKAIQCWAGAGAKTEYRDLLKFCAAHKISPDTPWKELTPEDQAKILTHKSKDYWGVLPWFQWLEKKTYKMHVRVFLSRYRTQIVCPRCQGARLVPEALAFRIDGKTISEISSIPISELLAWIEKLRDSGEERFSKPLLELLSALHTRLRTLCDLGLPYLTLERQARTLSGGETQRVNLATALGSELISTQFVLDEPSVGLHPRDTQRLIEAVHKLRDQGNSVLMVEHDLDCIEASDYVVELGPEAGEKGGEIVFSGPIDKWTPFPVEIGGLGKKSALIGKNAPILKIRSASARNLRGFDLSIPLNAFVCLTGVSGSGKSTLVNEVIMKAYQRHKIGLEDPSEHDIVEGFSQLEEVLLVDQTPLAKSPRANIGTYSGIWEEIRTILATTEDAHTRALGKSAFSFNVDAGRCPACKGSGFIREDMQFLSDVYIPCEICLGNRFQPTVLEVKYKGMHVADLLNMSIEKCAEFFKETSRIAQASQLLCDLGLGHLTLGHPLSELSGGEAQRLKLIPLLQSSMEREGKGTLLIFDEPTTGLHYRDTQRLIKLFLLLKKLGHTVLCVEHNLSLIAASDWIIDLGPEGGAKGGELLLQGPPASLIARQEIGYTAKFLAEYVTRYASGTPRLSASNSTRPVSSLTEHLAILGAREHNLKNLDITLPLRQLVAITGVSGSGKSTVAKDIIYAEGQRRYLDCLSPYARQFIKELKKPEIEAIHNIAPTVCVYQHTFQPSSLSTVATMSEVYNFLRLLFAKTAIQYCPDHPAYPITPLAPEDIAKEVRARNDKSIRLLAPIIKSKKGHHRAVLERAAHSELVQIRVDGVFLSPGSVSNVGGLERNKVHSIDFVIARFNPKTLEPALLLESIQQALSLGGGTMIVLGDRDEIVYSTERTCPVCKKGFFKPDPEDLSFNSKRGRCAVCQGTGKQPEGKKKDASGTRPCKECGGSRLSETGRNLRIDGLAIHEVSGLTPSQLLTFLNELSLPERFREISLPILRELSAKAHTLTNIGLDYLPLNRDCNTLSSGELQRLRLATAISSTLSGACYIFDEPSAGLHPFDNRHVLGELQRLKSRGNSILIIEHDPESIMACEHVLDIGPGGGKNGGKIVFNGNMREFLECGDSLTAAGLRDHLASGNTLSAPAASAHAFLRVEGAGLRNVKNPSLAIPLQKLVSIVGVSGSGKSTLVHGIIRDTLGNDPSSATAWVSEYASLTSDKEIARIVEIDQKPIGINSRSTPASYLKVWDEIRDLFANTNEARAKGFTAGFFSYNSGKGRCPECRGLGVVKLEMSFLPDAEVICEACGGNRYTDEALTIHYLGKNVADVLKLSFEEARVLFANHRKIYHTLQLACELGLDYLSLGQSSATLSGGESQRIKLVSELAQRRKGHTLYLLDEPTTGLHKSDVSKLIHTFNKLIEQGNSIFVIEHDVDVLLSSDHIIELGVGPGEKGGKILFEGSPAALTRARTPWGEFLREKKQDRVNKLATISKSMLTHEPRNSL